jgi:hypothetical protein
LARAHGGGADAPNFSFSQKLDGDGEGQKTTEEKSLVEKDRARLQWRLNMAVAESFVLMATDWSQLCHALAHNEVGVPKLDGHVVVEAYPSSPHGIDVFVGEDLVQWINANLEGIETREEAGLICTLLVRMREIVPFGSNPTEGSAVAEWKETGWYCFGGDHSFRGGLRLQEAVASAVGHGDYGLGHISADDFYGDIMPTVRNVFPPVVSFDQPDYKMVYDAWCAMFFVAR